MTSETELVIANPRSAGRIVSRDEEYPLTFLMEQRWGGAQIPRGLPFIVYVKAERRQNYEGPCSCDPVFRASPASIEEWCAYIGKADVDYLRIYLCPCLGRLIE